MERLRDWIDDHRKPEGVGWRSYLRFMRCVLACAVFGHVEPKLIYKEEKVGERGDRARITLRHACERCGVPLEEHTSVGQFPQRHRSDQNRWLHP